MTRLAILEFPDRRLRQVAKEVTTFTPELEQLAQNMLETMYEAPGVGLAATQVNVHIRLIVVDVSEEKDAPYLLVNPRWEALGGSQEVSEGCLSVPGIYEMVSRPQHIRVSAATPAGDPITFDADGLLAQCIQHECDHLDGKLFVDYLSPLKRQRIKKKLEKQQRERA